MLMHKTNFRDDFPILQQSIRGKPLIYLDSSVTSQKPFCVINAIRDYYLKDNANIHRGVYELSARATKLYEKTRVHLKQFIHAKHAHEIIFVRGTTEAINLVAQCSGIKPGDEVIVSSMEHHSNLVPWQMVGATLRVIPISDKGELDLNAYQQLFSEKTKMVAVTHASNVLGTINPIKQISEIAHAHGVPITVDGAQAFPHLPVDMQELGCDFYAFSAHKAYGPTGIGVLYGKTTLLEKMPPYQGGGNMIETVSFDKVTFNQLPYKFEAGTPDISGVIAFDSALQYLHDIGMNNIVQHEQDLLNYATEKLLNIPGLKIFGTTEKKVGVISFTIDGIHPHDIGTVLDSEGIAVRAGHHCAMPLMERFQVPAMVRVSFGLYNTIDDIDALVAGLLLTTRLFA